MRKLNCWEYKKCGRQPGGPKENEFGVCPAAVDLTNAGKNGGGKAAGRFCWKVAGTYCDGNVQGAFQEKVKSCPKCDFFQIVMAEEGASFQL